MSPRKVHIFSDVKTPYIIEAHRWVKLDGRTYAPEPEKDYTFATETWKSRTLIPFSVEGNKYAFLGPYVFPFLV